MWPLKTGSGRGMTVPPAGPDGEPVSWTLVCNGLMTQASVFFNGQLLGQAANQYRRWMYRIPAGTGELELRFSSIQPVSPCMWQPLCGKFKPSAASTSVRQEYLSWGNTGVENDYQPLKGAFPQGPWLSVYMVANSKGINSGGGAGANSTVMIKDVVVQTSAQPANPLDRLTDSNNSFVSTVTVHLKSEVAASHTIQVSGN